MKGKSKKAQIDKHLDLARKLWNMRVKVIKIIICTFRTVPKGLERELEEVEIRGRIEIIQTTALLRATRILRKVLET